MSYKMEKNVLLELRMSDRNLLFKAKVDPADMQYVYTETAIYEKSQKICAGGDPTIGDFYATEIANLLCDFESAKFSKIDKDFSLKQAKSFTDHLMLCYCCKEPLVWNSDFDLREVNEDYLDEDEQGIMTLLSCNNGECEVDIVEVTRKFKKNA